MNKVGKDLLRAVERGVVVFRARLLQKLELSGWHVVVVVPTRNGVRGVVQAQGVRLEEIVATQTHGKERLCRCLRAWSR